MARTLLLGAESALPTTTGTATSFSQASAVRLVNNSSTAYNVTVVETQSGNVVGSMTMPGNSIETLEKQYSHCVYADNASVLGAKVGFTA
jgi:dihydroxyacetone kinase